MCNYDSITADLENCKNSPLNDEQEEIEQEETCNDCVYWDEPNCCCPVYCDNYSEFLSKH